MCVADLKIAMTWFNDDINELDSKEDHDVDWMP